MSLIHDDRNLSDIEKFHYLRSSVKGQAFRLTESIDICTNNYEAAWNFLNGNYNDCSVLKTKHIKGLLIFEKATKESSKKMRSFVE